MPEITTDEIQQVCEWITATLPKGSTFFILAANDNDGDKEQVLIRYASNMTRENGINMMKAWLIERGKGEDWMEKVK